MGRSGQRLLSIESCSLLCAAFIVCAKGQRGQALTDIPESSPAVILKRNHEIIVKHPGTPGGSDGVAPPEIIPTGGGSECHNETTSPGTESHSILVTRRPESVRIPSTASSSWHNSILESSGDENVKAIPGNQHENLARGGNVEGNWHPFLHRRLPRSAPFGGQALGGDAGREGQGHPADNEHQLPVLAPLGQNKKPVISVSVSVRSHAPADNSRQSLPAIPRTPHLLAPPGPGVEGQGSHPVRGGHPGSRTAEVTVDVRDCSLLEEAATDLTGQTGCSVVGRGVHLPTSKECRGRDDVRSSDGTCNNRLQPLLGAAFQPFKRYLPPAYFDGAGAPRSQSRQVDSQGRPLALPSARLVSRTVHLVKDAPSKFTGLMMQFGQFLDHDITATSMAREAGKGLNCCGQARFSNEACFPIAIPAGDTHFTDTSCMNFLRSLPATDGNRKLPLTPREQRNDVTSFLDASVIYGSTNNQTAALREFRQGLLRSSSGDMLPLESGGMCVAEDKLCLKSGDMRVNEFPGLSALHVLFHRHHNQLARRLAALLPPGHGWPPAAVDEAIFQTARRLVTAQLQHIAYVVWLPLVLGRAGILRHQLADGPITYDDSRDPAVANAFATAAFRFGHSLVPDFLQYGDERIPLHQTFANPKFVRNGLQKVLEGLLTTAAQSRDMFFAAALRNRLFESAPRRGLDLVAINIQRGRDHGLPPYNAWRRLCGLPSLTDFDSATLGDASAALREVYMSVDDVDLFSGGIAEPALEGALVGPTFACIIGRQFSDLKFGDRFFYQARATAGFSADQLRFIQGTTLATMICDNTSIRELQGNPFLQESEENPRLACSQLATPAPLYAWRQELNQMLLALAKT